MSAPSPHASPAPHAVAAGHGHASIATYIRVAVVLTVVTALEFACIYINAVRPVLVPILLVLSALKFALVVLFFMHLRYDSRVLTTLFVGPLVIAAGIGIALMTLTGAFLLFSR